MFLEFGSFKAQGVALTLETTGIQQHVTPQDPTPETQKVPIAELCVFLGGG